jgi:hypothetical protein
VASEIAHFVLDTSRSWARIYIRYERDTLYFSGEYLAEEQELIPLTAAFDLDQGLYTEDESVEDIHMVWVSFLD